jgi:EmrB/QacA subfamily drug resistance transporter
VEKKWWTLLVVCAATFMLLLDVTIVIVALPEIQRGLHASFSDVQWVIDAYALTLASLLLTAGTLADRYGRRLLFIIGLSIFTLGSLLCGFAQSPLMLTLSRMAQGVGGAILFATSLALLAHSFRGKDRGVAFGVWGAITGVAVALGPVLGGVITTGISWRAIFLVNIPIGVIAIIITVWKVEESRTPQASRPDWAGFAVLTVGLVSLVYGLIRASETTWGNIGVIICLAVAVVLFITFVILEQRVAHPMFDLSLFRVPTFTGGLCAAFAMNGSLYAVLLYIVLYLQNDLGYSALGTGARLLVLSGGTLVAATIAGRLSSHMPVRWLIGPGLALVGIGLLLMSGISATTSWTHLIWGFVLAGVGSGLVNPPLASTAVGVVTPDRSGMASGVNTTFRQIGIAVGIAVYATIFSTALENGLRHSLSRISSSTPSSTAVVFNLNHVVTLVKEGEATQVIKGTPPALREQVVHALQSSFTGALNDLFVISGILALVGALFAVVFIRPKDFVAQQQHAGAAH